MHTPVMREAKFYSCSFGLSIHIWLYIWLYFFFAFLYNFSCTFLKKVVRQGKVKKTVIKVKTRIECLFLGLEPIFFNYWPFTKFDFFIIKIANEKENKIFSVNVGFGDPGVDSPAAFYQFL